MQLSFYHSDTIEHFFDSKTVHGSSALHFAARDGDMLKIRKLINLGASVNEQNMRGETPLHWACSSSDVATISFLLSKGAFVDIQDQDGNTPLHWACEDENIKIIKNLIAAGADVEAENYEFELPIEYAIMSGSKQTAKLLKNLSNEREEDILALPCEYDQPKIVKMLLQMCDFSVCGLDSALRIATDVNDSKCTKILSLFINENSAT